MARLQYPGLQQAPPLATPPVIETITVDKWYPRFIEPVWKKSSAAALAASSGIIFPVPVIAPPFNPRGTGAVIVWPRRLQYPGYQGPLPTTGEVVQLDKWQPNYPDKVYGKTLPAATRDSSGLTETVPQVFAETIFVDKWQPNFPDSARAKTSVSAANQPSLSAPTGSFPTQETFPTTWGQPLSQPYPKIIYGAPYIGFLKGIIAGPGVPPENITADKWFVEWSRPVFAKPYPAALRSFWSADTKALGEVILADKWVGQYPDRVDRKPLAISNRSTADFFAPVNAASPISADRFLLAWSEPVRQRLMSAALNASSGVTFAPQPTTESIFVDKWQPAFPDRIAPKVGLAASAVPTLSWPPFSTPSNLTEHLLALGQPRQLILSSPARQTTLVGPPRQLTAVGLYRPTFIIIAELVGTNIMAQTKQLTPPIDVGENETVVFDYGLVLLPGVTITSVFSVTATVPPGSTDPTPQTRIIGAAQVTPSPTAGSTNTAVAQLVGQCVANNTYVLQCLANTSDGQLLSLFSHLPCIQPS